MPKLIFRPNLWGCALVMLMISLAGIGSVIFSRVDMRIWQTLIVFIPLLCIWHLVISMMRRGWHARLEFDTRQILFHDGQTLRAVNYDEIESFRLARGIAFDGQSPEHLVVVRHNDTKPESWNIADFSLSSILRVLCELSLRTSISNVPISQHNGEEKTLRRCARGLGEITPIADEEAELYIGHALWNHNRLFLFKPHR